MVWSIGSNNEITNIRIIFQFICFSLTHINHQYFRAIDKVSNIPYAVKIIENYEENIEDILQEYKILFEHSLHPNIPLLFGAYR